MDGPNQCPMVHGQSTPFDSILDRLTSSQKIRRCSMSCPLFEEALLYITSNGANEMMFFSHMFFWLCSYRGRDSRHKTLDMFSLLKF